MNLTINYKFFLGKNTFFVSNIYTRFQFTPNIFLARFCYWYFIFVSILSFWLTALMWWTKNADKVIHVCSHVRLAVYMCSHVKLAVHMCSHVKLKFVIPILPLILKKNKKTLSSKFIFFFSHPSLSPTMSSSLFSLSSVYIFFFFFFSSFPVLYKIKIKIKINIKIRIPLLLINFLSL